MTQPQRFVRVCSPQHFCQDSLGTYRRAPPFAPKGGCVKKLVTYMQASSVATRRLSSWRHIYWSWTWDSNPEPPDYKAGALAIAPVQHIKLFDNYLRKYTSSTNRPSSYINHNHSRILLTYTHGRLSNGGSIHASPMATRFITVEPHLAFHFRAQNQYLENFTELQH